MFPQIQGKSPDPDGVPSEVLKNCDLNETILDLCNLGLDGEIPSIWSLLDLIPVPKAGHLSNRDNNRGFRKGRSTTDHILALRRILKEYKRSNLSAVVTFIDFKKAFESINRRSMFKILKAYDIPPRRLSAIESVYTNTRAAVVTPSGISDQFKIISGALQGDTLAPFIFIIVLDYAKVPEL